MRGPFGRFVVAIGVVLVAAGAGLAVAQVSKDDDGGALRAANAGSATVLPPSSTLSTTLPTTSPAPAPGKKKNKGKKKKSGAQNGGSTDPVGSGGGTGTFVPVDNTQNAGGSAGGNTPAKPKTQKTGNGGKSAKGKGKNVAPAADPPPTVPFENASSETEAGFSLSSMQLLLIALFTLGLISLAVFRRIRPAG